ncbi:MAG TPA: Hsp70 family protein [Deferrisomatales bacterium]|nr:Hsp70 family protein [Deferrisomatales bacterium]
MINLTIDMGNYNTIITFAGEQQALDQVLPGVAAKLGDLPGALFVPSLVHIGEDRIRIGEEVLSAGLYEDEGCFRDLKDHVLHHAPVARNVRGLRVTHKKAAADFLSELTARLHAGLGQAMNVVFLFPNLDGELFREHLRYVDLAGARSVTLVDEDTAVALGYGVNLFADDLLLVFDFGFSAVRARLLQFHWLGRESYQPPIVRASMALPVGTADLKLKILRELHSHDDTDASMPAFYWKKFSLHSRDADTWSHVRFQELLAKENLAAQVQAALDGAMEEARLGGLRASDVKKVLLLGGGTRIPLVRRTLEENFGDRVLGDLPELAPGRGGVQFLTESPVDDMVNDAYTLQMRDPITGEYHYPVLVEKFTRFPTANPTSRFVVNTFYDGQYELQLNVFRTQRDGEHPGGREILFGDDGKISFVGAGAGDAHEPAMASPLVIPVNPPGRLGERRFLLEFKVDSQKRLLLTVKDLREEKLLWEDKPIIDLR